MVAGFGLQAGELEPLNWWYRRSHDAMMMLSKCKRMELHGPSELLPNQLLQSTRKEWP